MWLFPCLPMSTFRHYSISPSALFLWTSCTFVLSSQIMQYDRPKFCVWLEAKLKVLPTKNAGGVEAVSATELAEFHKAVTQAERTKEITRALVDFSRFFSWHDGPARWGRHPGRWLPVAGHGEVWLGVSTSCHVVGQPVTRLSCWPGVVSHGPSHRLWFSSQRIMNWQLLKICSIFNSWEFPSSRDGCQSNFPSFLPWWDDCNACLSHSPRLHTFTLQSNFYLTSDWYCLYLISWI